MYVKQKMYFVDGDILETNLLQKTMNEEGHWILGPRSFRDICLYDSQIILAHVLSNYLYSLMDVSENIILLHSDSDDDVCLVIDHFDASPFLVKLELPLHQVYFLWMLITPLTVYCG